MDQQHTAQSSRPIARCALHGLGYDPQQHTGCVVCRRGTTPPSQPPGSAAPAIDAGPGSFWRDWPRPKIYIALRLAFAVVLNWCTSLILAAAGGENPGLGGALFFGVACFAAFAVCAILRRRTFRLFSYLLPGAILVLFLFRMRDATAHADEESDRTINTTSEDGNLIINVPAQWQRMRADTPNVKLKLAATDGRTSLVYGIEDAPDPNRVDLQGSLARMAERLGPLGAVQAKSRDCVVASQAGMCLSFSGTLGNLPAVGELLLTQAKGTLHEFVVISEPEAPKRRTDLLLKCVGEARLRSSDLDARIMAPQ
jgi:hypothetical protein